MCEHTPEAMEDRSNALLIAAVRDLLAACKAMVLTWGTDDEDAAIRARDLAISAIAKVEGVIRARS